MRIICHRSASKRWSLYWLLVPVIILYPVNNFITRTALLAGLTAVWIGTLRWLWNKKTLRIGLLTCTGLIALFLILPGRQINALKLRKRYVESLQIYEGTKYIWGGETRLGIDCSGLVRKGLIIADYREGIVSLNPSLLREGFSLWWHDCSAKALGEDYRNGTRRLFWARSLNDLDHFRILPGDIAVTSSGVHTLAYLGNQTWIEADPDAHRVIRVTLPTQNQWFFEPVNLIRWHQFEGTNDSGSPK